MNAKFIAGAALALASAAAWPHEEPAKAAPAPGLSANAKLSEIRRAPDFALPDVNGRPVRLAQLRGRVVLVAFIYTTCSSACPLLTSQMAQLQRRLIDDGLSPGRAVLLSISVDAERDTPSALAAYARRFDARAGWHFLHDSAERLQRVLADYDEWTRRLPDGDLDHPARLHLIDAQGRVREIYSLAFFDERQAYLDISRLLREADKPRHRQGA
jgi:protein SCO1/2